MSDCINVINFNKNKLVLEMRFDGEDFYTASVKFKLFARNGDSRVNQETPYIPVKSLFDLSYLIDMNARRVTAQYELEVQEMVDKIEQKKHPFKNIGGTDGEKDKAE